MSDKTLEGRTVEDVVVNDKANVLDLQTLDEIDAGSIPTSAVELSHVMTLC